MPIVWDRAEGFQVYDKWGNTWIDFTSTIFVTNSGHASNETLTYTFVQEDEHSRELESV